jgi:hypothetical protein
MPNEAAFASTHEPETTVTEQNDTYDPRKNYLYHAYLAATILRALVASGNARGNFICNLDA